MEAKETKYGIATKYGLTVTELEQLNPQIVGGLNIGQTLVLKPGVQVKKTTNVTLVDFAPAPIEAFATRYPNFPTEQLICADFFELSSNQYQFDWVLEQTFFCAINPQRRDEYVQQMARLLKPKGELVGLLFDKDFGHTHPPFGGDKEEYEQRFKSHFDIEIMEPCYHSHPARQGSELFIKLRAR